MKNILKRNGFGCFLVVAVLLFSSGCANTDKKAANEKLVKSVYAAYEQKDWNMLTSLFAPGFTFTSPNDDHIDLKAYKVRCWPNCNNIAKFDFEKVMVEGDEAYVTYRCLTKNGKTFRNTEYFILKDGKIKEFTCFFGPGIGFPNNTSK
ncbi:MAG: nuclear transport factor 2 family protein [Bacteroidetes bacterium]|nr:nuclear transport factor 2 family protein [Bacteroidota bacterium]